MKLETDRPLVYLSRRLVPDVENLMREKFALRVNQSDQVLSPEDLIANAQGAQVLVVTPTERVTHVVLKKLSTHLRILATFSVGHDHLDLAAAKALNIKVLYTPEVLSGACAEVAMMLILNACRRGYEADSMIRAGQWTGWAPNQLLGLELSKRRMFIFGMGRIGREIAVRARAFGLEIHYHNRNKLASHKSCGAIYHDTLDDGLKIADILVVAAPGSANLRGLFDEKRLALLPNDAVVVNISRGDIINDDALIAGLSERRIFAAGLDVFANEPNIDERYKLLPNVFLCPHIGSATFHTRSLMGKLLVNGIESLIVGEVPKNLLI